MAVSTDAPGGRATAPSAGRRGRRTLGAGSLVLLAGAVLLAAALHWSGATLAGDPSALARVEVQPFGGKLEQARVRGSDGRAVPVVAHGGRLTPQEPLAPGERVSVDVTVRRPGWDSWLLGRERHERLTLRAPDARVRERWFTVAAGRPVQVGFDQPVQAVAYGSAGHLRRLALEHPQSTVTLGPQAAAGSVEVAAAPRVWEELGAPQPVTWFPAAHSPTVVASPGAGTKVSPATPLRLTFSAPVADVLGSRDPTLRPSTPGRWRRVDSHTLVFTPSGSGVALGTRLQVELPRLVALAGPGGALHTTRQVAWSVPPGSTLRLEELLAGLGYLPLDWRPAGPAVARTPEAELRAAVDAPRGSFSWRYPNTPPELRALWHAGRANDVSRGAIVAFEDAHGLSADGFAGPRVWRALLADEIQGKRRTGGYSYVYVHRDLPQSLTLWHDGHTVLRSPGNTGVPAAPTQLGTFPVFEHIPVGTMSGTNPGGSTYNDPGIRYISYFNGGDAIHAFTRASFGTPQSLGCVELPLASAAKVWPYTPIGTLVTVER